MDNSNNENTAENNFTHSIQISNELISAQDNIDLLNSLRNAVILPAFNSIFGNLDLLHRPILDLFEDFRSTLGETLATIIQNNINILPDIYLSLNNLRELFVELEEQYSPSGEVREAYKNSGWPIAPSLPVSFNRYVVELDRKGKAKQAWRKIMGYYHKDNFNVMKDMVKSWEETPSFHYRMPIIYDALEAHCQEKYTLSIPALLPQIEGLLTEFALDNEIKIKYGKPNAISKQVLQTQNQDVISEAMSSITLEYCNYLYTYNKFEKELKKGHNNRKVTRNTILHGISTNYATPSLSLKLFLSLDYLSGLENIKILSTKDE